MDWISLHSRCCFVVSLFTVFAIGSWPLFSIYYYFIPIDGIIPVVLDEEIDRLTREYFPANALSIGAVKFIKTYAILTSVYSSADASDLSSPFIFSSMLHPSWKESVMSSWQAYVEGLETTTRVDLIVYCVDEACDFLPDDCMFLIEPYYVTGVTWHQCFFRPLPSSRKSVKYLEAFSYIMDSELADILRFYDLILRTDPDNMITPLLFSWHPITSLTLGAGKHSNSKHARLIEEAVRHLEWQVVSTEYLLNETFVTGLSFFADPHSVIVLSYYMVHIIKDMHSIGGLFHHKPFSSYNPTLYYKIWPDWFRKIKLYYAIEIALKCGVPEFDIVTNMQRESIDANSNYDISILEGAKVIRTVNLQGYFEKNTAASSFLMPHLEPTTSTVYNHFHYLDQLEATCDFKPCKFEKCDMTIATYTERIFKLGSVRYLFQKTLGRKSIIIS